MKWPYKVRHRKNGPVLAKIYQPCEGRESYRVAWQAGGRRMMKSFPRFAGAGGARQFAEGLVREIAQDSQVAALTAAEARSALAIRDALEQFRRETSRSISPIQAITEYLAAVRKLGDRPLSEAVAGYLGTVATIKRLDLTAAIREFCASHEPKTKSKDGKRAKLSPVYAYMVAHFLGHFGAAFPGYAVQDLTRDHIDLFFADKKRAELSSKTRNHYRATIKLFLRWAVKKDYLPTNHRLLEAPGMERDQGTDEKTDFYRPHELRRLLENADEVMRPIIALCGLAGLRVQEALRLSWQDVFSVPGHVEISSTKSKTRSRRLVEMVGALTEWLEPYRQHEGALWTSKPAYYIERFTKLRDSLKIPSRKNGLRHAYISFHYAIHGNENLTSQQAGNSPTIVHQSYKGLATKNEAEAWFNVRPLKAADNIVVLGKVGAA